MEFQARVSFWDGREGSSYIAELHETLWRFWAREWAGVAWREVSAEPRLVQMAEARSRGLVLSRVA